MSVSHGGQLGMMNIHIKAYLVDATGTRVGSAVDTVHPLAGTAVIEERVGVHSLRMIYEISSLTAKPHHTGISPEEGAL